jgi:hypothetical protein
LPVHPDWPLLRVGVAKVFALDLGAIFADADHLLAVTVITEVAKPFPVWQLMRESSLRSPHRADGGK